MSAPQVKCTYTSPEQSSQENPANVEIEISMTLREEPRDSSLIRVVVAPASLCKGWHKLTWKLIGLPMVIEDFHLLSHVPDRVAVFDPVLSALGTWTAIVENKGVEATNGLRFDFGFHPESNISERFRLKDFIHDPTIAVTPDPLDPPTT
jgi:hypothetical protein